MNLPVARNPKNLSYGQVGCPKHKGKVKRQCLRRVITVARSFATCPKGFGHLWAESEQKEFCIARASTFLSHDFFIIFFRSRGDGLLTRQFGRALVRIRASVWLQTRGAMLKGV